MDPKVLAGKATDLRTTVALFGRPLGPAEIRRLYNIFSELFQTLGHAPNVAGVSVSKPKGRIYGRYRRLTAAVEGILQNENVHNVEIAYVPPPETDASRFAHMSVRFGDGQFVLNVKDTTLSVHDERVARLIATVSEITSPVYGYGYALDKPYGPGFHAVGIGFMRLSDKGVIPPLPSHEVERGARWSNRREEALPLGILRDVYPINYLTEIHTAKTIDGRLLLDWIGEDISRGELRLIRDGAWLWQVPEERCAEIGSVFETASLLV